METLGKRIQKLRKAKGFTQEELAQKLFLSSKTISSWEQDRTLPSLNVIVLLSEILDTTTTYFLYDNIKRLDIETEVKFPISKKQYEEFQLYFKEQATFIRESKQEDTYYNPKYHSFLTNDIIHEWLRVSVRNGKTMLNYKYWYDVHCDEYELEIDDKEMIEKILHALQFEVIAIVNKTRLSYMYQDKYEISLDYVQELGYFIEIEVKKYDKDILYEYDDLLKLARSFALDLDKIDKRGYPYYLLKRKN